MYVALTKASRPTSGFGSAAIATALAFGLGGRDAAARYLERWADEAGPPSPPPAQRRIRGTGPDNAQPPLV